MKGNDLGNTPVLLNNCLLSVWLGRDCQHPNFKRDIWVKCGRVKFNKTHWREAGQTFCDWQTHLHLYQCISLANRQGRFHFLETYVSLSPSNINDLVSVTDRHFIYHPRWASGSEIITLKLNDVKIFKHVYMTILTLPNLTVQAGSHCSNHIWYNKIKKIFYQYGCQLLKKKYVCQSQNSMKSFFLFLYFQL